MFWISSRSAAARSKSSCLAAARISVSIRDSSFSIAAVLSRVSARLASSWRSEVYIGVDSATERSRSLRSWISLTIVVGSIPFSRL